MNLKNFIIVLLVLIAAAAVTNKQIKYNPQDEPQVSLFPLTIGDWQGTDIPLSDRDYKILETKNLFIRDYKNLKTGESVNFYVIYSQDNRKALHPPEICYTGGGATITKKTVIPLIGSFKANLFTIDSKQSRQMVVYWFKSTTLNTYSYLQQQLKVVVDHILGKKTSGAMIRISAAVHNNDPDSSLRNIKSFASQITPFLDTYVP
ncbi:MAG: exosortase C-terminal domain/associated protein EpsI [Candidatus Omnitrophota bacterium]